MKYKQLTQLVANLDAVIGSQETKVAKKLFKIFEKIKPSYEEYQAKVEELRLDNASTDDKGILLMDEKQGYKFTKEGIKTLTKQVNDLNEKEFDFKPIEVINTAGLENFIFLDEWTTGITFNKEEEL